jgi:cytochrome b
MFKVRIWDLPTRLFHWLLMLCAIGLVISGNVGGNAMVWHFRLGQAVLTLLLFRLLWGFAGGHWSRWSQLPLQPARLLAYWRGQGHAQDRAGHNPLGAWSVLAMLSWLLLQVLTGLVSDDEIAFAGPLSALVSSATVSAATAWHKGWGKWVLLALVALHLLAIAWYRLRRRPPLVPAMLHGDKWLETAVPDSRDDPARWGLAAVCLGVSALLVQWLLALGNS